MRRVFSDFLKTFHGRNEPRDLGLWQPMWEELCRELRRELRRRRLWELSPSILGVVGMARWQEEPVGGSLRGRSLEALDELASGAYQFIFIDRLAALRRHLEAKGEIEGLVRRNVRNFIYETQRRHDPLGTRIFAIVKSGVELALERETLHLLAGGAKIANDTLLGTRNGAAEQPGVDERLVELTKAWNDELLEPMMTANGKHRTQLVVELADRLASLEEEGVHAFTFGDLITPLKRDARCRWAAILSADARHWNEVVGLEEPPVSASTTPQRLEDRDRFAKLSRCVEHRLAQLPGQRRTRNHRLHLWRYLHRFSWEVDEFPEELPSFRELARILGIPRERFRELYETIKEELSGCLRAMQANSARAGKVSEPAEDSRMERSELRDRLLAATASRAAASGPRPGEGPVVVEEGQIHTLPETSEEGIEWLVLEVDPWSGLRLVPVDTFPMAGSRDLELSSPELGPLFLRLDLARWVPAHRLGRESVALQLAPEDLERVLVARARWVARRAAPSVLAEEADLDPEYRAWREEVEAASQRLARRPLAGHEDGLESLAPVDAGPIRRWRGSLALAATLVLLALGGWLASLLQRASLPDLYRQQAQLVAAKARAAAELSADGDPTEILRSVPAPRFRVLAPVLVTRGAGTGEPASVVPTDASQLYLLLVDAPETSDRVLLVPAGRGEASAPLAVLPVDWTEDGALVAIPTTLLAEADEFRLHLESSLGREVLETYHLKTTY